MALTSAALVGAILWAHLLRGNAYTRFLSESRQLAECELAAKKIVALRNQKQRALLRTKPAEELNRKVDDWVREAGISSKQIVRIQPGQPRRIGDTHYLEQVTELEVLETTLPKLLQFAQIAENKGEGLKLSSFRISPPRSDTREDGQDEVWTAELALTYIIYSPKSE